MERSGCVSEGDDAEDVVAADVDADDDADVDADADVLVASIALESCPCGGAFGYHIDYTHIASHRMCESWSVAPGADDHVCMLHVTCD